MRKGKQCLEEVFGVYEETSWPIGRDDDGEIVACAYMAFGTSQNHTPGYGGYVDDTFYFFSAKSYGYDGAKARASERYYALLEEKGVKVD